MVESLLKIEVMDTSDVALSTNMSMLNVAAYQFVQINDTEELRQRLHQRAAELELRGTVLIAEEGINFCLAGTAESVWEWLSDLRANERFMALQVKESWSATVPFKRLKVKVKNEIIRMDHPTIQPVARRAAFVLPHDLKRWLDQGHDDDGRAIVMLDTRKGFEADFGTFVGALNWRISKFTQFPKAFETHHDELVDKRVVSFCTGGIRCEKAAIYMREAGCKNVVQLNGGILKYFEEVGEEHFNGTCFVFDERVELDASLLTSFN